MWILSIVEWINDALFRGRDKTCISTTLVLQDWLINYACVTSISPMQYLAQVSEWTWFNGIWLS